LERSVAAPPVKPIRRKHESLIPIQKRHQLFIRVHNETLSVVAGRVCNPNRSSIGINRGDTAPNRFFEIVSYDFPLLHGLQETFLLTD
jgi:hypothetical protein